MPFCVRRGAPGVVVGTSYESADDRSGVACRGGVSELRNWIVNIVTPPATPDQRQDSNEVDLPSIARNCDVNFSVRR